MDLDVSVDARGIVRKENGRPLVFSFLQKKNGVRQGRAGRFFDILGKVS